MLREERRRRIRRLLAASGGISPPPAAERFHWELNGSDEYLADDTNRTYGIANQWSVVLNVRPDSVSGQHFLFDMRNISLSNASIIRILQESAAVRILLFNSAGALFKDLTWSGILSLGVGIHLVATFDGDDTGDPLLLYVNGSAASAPSGTDATGTQSDNLRALRIGRRIGTSGNHFQGGVQDAVVFDSVLTPGEVATVYSQVNDVDPFAGFGTPRLEFNPADAGDMGQNYGAAAGVNIMNDAANITAGDDRVQGNLIP